jgi:hypothetical protein
VSLLKYDSVVNEFLNAFPEYNSAYNEHIEYNNELLPHVFFGETINEDLPVLLEMNNDKEKLKNIFKFMERVATEGDIQVQELLSMTVLERLGDNPKLLEVAVIYMGDKTKIALDEIERFWGRQ